MANAVTLGHAYVVIGAKMSGTFNKTLASMRNMLSGVGGSLMKIGASVGGLGASITTPLEAAAMSAAHFQEEMAHTASIIGVTTKFISELSYAASLVEVPVQGVAKAMTFMSANLFKAATGGKGASGMLKLLGLNTKELLGMKPEDQFMAIADAISKVEDQTVKVAAARQFFGRGGVQLLPLINQGAGGLRENMGDASRLGVSVSAKEGTAAEKMIQMYRRFKLAIQGVANAVGTALIPILTHKFKIITNLLGRFQEYIRLHPELIQQAYAFGRALLIVGSALVGVGGAMKMLSGVFSTGGVFILAAAGVLYLTGALDGLVDKWKNVILDFQIGGRSIGSWLELVGKAWESVLPVFGAIGTYIKDIFLSVWEFLKAGFKVVEEAIVASLGSAVDSVAASVAKGKIAASYAVGLTGQEEALKQMDEIDKTVWENNKNRELDAAQAMNSAMSKLKAPPDLSNVWKALRESGSEVKGIMQQPLEDAFNSVMGKDGMAVKSMGDILKGLNTDFAEIGETGLKSGMASDLQNAANKAYETRGTFSGKGASFLSMEGAGGVQQKQLNELQGIRKTLQAVADNGGELVYGE